MAKVKRKSKAAKREFVSPFNNYWTNKNYILLGIGVFLLIVGFYFMSIGPYDSAISLTISPLILMIAYLIIFPLSILSSNKNKDAETEDDSSQSNG